MLFKFKVNLFENEAAGKEQSNGHSGRVDVPGRRVSAARSANFWLLLPQKNKALHRSLVFVRSSLFAHLIFYSLFAIRNSFTSLLLEIQIQFLMKMHVPEQRKKRAVRRNRALNCCSRVPFWRGIQRPTRNTSATGSIRPLTRQTPFKFVKLFQVENQ